MTFTQKLFAFQGRLRRRDFWLCILAQWGALMAYYMVVSVLGLAMGLSAGSTSDPNTPPSGAALALLIVNGLLFTVLIAGLVWTGIAVQVKRCHDRNQSGWFVLFGFIPFFNLVNLGILDGSPGANRFGPSPKNPEPTAEVFA